MNKFETSVQIDAIKLIDCGLAAAIQKALSVVQCENCNILTSLYWCCVCCVVVPFAWGPANRVASSLRNAQDAILRFYSLNLFIHFYLWLRSFHVYWILIRDTQTRCAQLLKSLSLSLSFDCVRVMGHFFSFSPVLLGFIFLGFSLRIYLFAKAGARFIFFTIRFSFSTFCCVFGVYLYHTQTFI